MWPSSVSGERMLVTGFSTCKLGHACRVDLVLAARSKDDRGDCEGKQLLIEVQADEWFHGNQPWHTVELRARDGSVVALNDTSK